jgi:hypothetical protein
MLYAAMAKKREERLIQTRKAELPLLADDDAR